MLERDCLEELLCLRHHNLTVGLSDLLSNLPATTTTLILHAPGFGTGERVETDLIEQRPRWECLEMAVKWFPAEHD